MRVVRSGVAALVAAAGLTAVLTTQGEERPSSTVSDAIVPAVVPSEADRAHAAVFDRSQYPSATECRACHPDHYREWSVSQHAYAQISPVFNAMQARTDELNNGTFGDFCIRCHTPIGMEMGEPVHMSNEDRAPVSLEGVTCIACHRVNDAYGKNSGRRAVQRGELFDPVYGPRSNEELKRVIGSPDEFGRVVTEPGEPGRRIHSDAVPFFQLTTSGFCGSCHDVTFINGFRLEEAFSSYKHSPAAARGETCQDCHMGTEPGHASGYAVGPAAVVGGVPTTPRKRTNHMFSGPDYSIVHPGIFPHNPVAKELATVREWLAFNYKAGWGTDDYEDEADFDAPYPERWASPDDRYEAREVIDAQLALLDTATQGRLALLRRGYLLGEIETASASLGGGIELRVPVRNGTDGHNAPTGFIAERVVYLRVTVTDEDGEVVFVSGDLDPNGDLRDLHSAYVHNGELPLDEQLFNLQSKFLTRNVRGGEREEVLSVNTSLDPLPFARPDTSPSIITGATNAARIHRMSIEPLGERIATYRVDPDLLTGPGAYTVRVQLIAGMVPPNLIGAIAMLGFDYGLSAREVARRVVDGQMLLHDRTVTIGVE